MTNEEVIINVEGILEQRIKEKIDEEKISRGTMNNIIIHIIKEAKQGDSQRM